MIEKKSITFLMPGSAAVPSGGYKVVFEQANRLADKGYEVHLAYPVHTIITRLKFRNIIGIIKRYFQGFIGTKYKASKWFSLNKEIKEHKIFSLNYKRLPLTKFYCATSLETSYFLNKFNISANDKIYYVQGYETWNVPEPYASNSYSFEMKKIAIAPYLVSRINETGNKAYLIFNGFDFNAFGLDVPIENRNKFVVMMMYSSNNDIKRCSDSIAALKIVKGAFPELRVLVFGVPARPKDLPQWFEYHRTPDRKTLRTLYNSASIFIAASRTEGMALPPAEAFICGCALCCTDIDGFGVYAIAEETALLSPVYDVSKLAGNIIRLIDCNEMRIDLAKNGNRLMQKFTWEKASEEFVDVLEKS